MHDFNRLFLVHVPIELLCTFALKKQGFHVG